MKITPRLRGARQVAMRWRTAGEVIDGKGDITCANLRCKHHTPKPSQERDRFGEQETFIALDNGDSLLPKPAVALEVLQTQFGYMEDGLRKIAEVKLNLCRRCTKKMKACKRSSEPGPSALDPAPSRSVDSPQELENAPSSSSVKRSRSRSRRHRSRSASLHQRRSISPRRARLPPSPSKCSISPDRSCPQLDPDHDSSVSLEPTISSSEFKPPKFKPYRSTIAQWRQPP